MNVARGAGPLHWPRLRLSDFARGTLAYDLLCLLLVLFLFLTSPTWLADPRVLGP